VLNALFRKFSTRFLFPSVSSLLIKTQGDENVRTYQVETTSDSPIIVGREVAATIVRIVEGIGGKKIEETINLDGTHEIRFSEPAETDSLHVAKKLKKLLGYHNARIRVIGENIRRVQRRSIYSH